MCFLSAETNPAALPSTGITRFLRYYDRLRLLAAHCRQFRCPLPPATTAPRAGGNDKTSQVASWFTRVTAGIPLFYAWRPTSPSDSPKNAGPYRVATTARAGIAPAENTRLAWRTQNDRDALIAVLPVGRDPAIAQGLGDMDAADAVGAIKVGEGAGDP